MRYHIDPEWLVDCDDGSCQLIRLRIITGENARGKKPSPENIGKQREEGMGFYANLEQALVHGYLNKRVQVARDEAQPGIELKAEDVIAEIRAARDAVRTMLAGMKK